MYELTAPGEERECGQEALCVGTMAEDGPQMMKDRKPHIQEELRSPGPTTGKKTTFPPNPVKLLKTKEKILQAATGKKPCSPPRQAAGPGLHSTNGESPPTEDSTSNDNSLPK